MNAIYDLIVIGGGISSCTLISNVLKKGFKGKIAVVEVGRGLGGRSSTRFSNKDSNRIFNHGSPNFNITNILGNTSLDIFIKDLIDKKFIKHIDNSFFNLDENYKITRAVDNEFYKGKVYIPKKYMSEFVNNLIQQYNNENQIDFYFETLIDHLDFRNNIWKISSKVKQIISGKFLVCSSNLLLHKRSLKILNVDEIPLRKAILSSKNNKIDEILYLTNKQSYVKRINFLITTKHDFKLKGNFDNEIMHLISSKRAEQKTGIERIVFQKHLDKRTGIVIHTKYTENAFNLNIQDNDYLNIYLLKILNKVLKKNLVTSNNLTFENISVMNWRASQPLGRGIPERLQVCNDYKIAFCGDWFQFEGFGRVQGAILSGLNLSEKIIDSMI